MKAKVTENSEEGKVGKGEKSGSAKIDSIPFIKLLGRSQKKRFLKLVTNSFYANNYDPHLIRSKVTPLVKKLIEDYGLNLFTECIEQLRLPLYNEELQQVLDKNNYYMKQCKPTEKQLNLLNSLHYTGPKPETCYDASEALTDIMKNRHYHNKESKSIIKRFASSNNENKTIDFPTEKQLQFLISLKYDGPIPKNKLEASKIIDDCLSYKKMYGKR